MRRSRCHRTVIESRDPRAYQELEGSHAWQASAHDAHDVRALCDDDRNSGRWHAQLGLLRSPGDRVRRNRRDGELRTRGTTPFAREHRVSRGRSIRKATRGAVRPEHRDVSVRRDCLQRAELHPDRTGLCRGSLESPDFHLESRHHTDGPDEGRRHHRRRHCGPRDAGRDGRSRSLSGGELLGSPLEKRAKGPLTGAFPLYGSSIHRSPGLASPSDETNPIGPRGLRDAVADARRPMDRGKTGRDCSACSRALPTMRFAIASVVLVAACGVTRTPLPFGRWRPIAAAAACGVLGFNTLAFLGLSLTPASDTALIIPTTIPLATALFATLIHERLTARRLVGFAIATVGAALVIVGGQQASGEASSERLRGDLMELGAAALWGASLTIGALVVRKETVLGYVTLMVLIGTAMLLPLGAVPQAYRVLTPWTGETWFADGLLVVISASVDCVLFVRGVLV